MGEVVKKLLHEILLDGRDGNDYLRASMITLPI